MVGILGDWAGASRRLEEQEAICRAEDLPIGLQACLGEQAEVAYHHDELGRTMSALEAMPASSAPAVTSADRSRSRSPS